MLAISKSYVNLLNDFGAISPATDGCLSTRSSSQRHFGSLLYINLICTLIPFLHVIDDCVPRYKSTTVQLQRISFSICTYTKTCFTIPVYIIGINDKGSKHIMLCNNVLNLHIAYVYRTMCLLCENIDGIDESEYTKHLTMNNFKHMNVIQMCTCN